MTCKQAIFRVAAVLLFLACVIPTLHGEEPAKKTDRGQPKTARLDLAWPGVVKKAQNLEAVQMFSLILDKGADMGPGDGWFHPGESRYSWAWLAARHKIDAKAKIERKAFQGSPELFERFDRNKDGMLSADDFDWSDRSAFARQAMPANMWFRMMDTNSNGRVSRE